MSARPDTEIAEPGTRKMAAGELRAINERAVLTAVAASEGLSGAEIARQTGLAAQTVSRILLDLEGADLVLRGEPRRGMRGQPATPILLNPDGAYSLGCELGWRHIEIVLRNLGGEILARHRRDYPFPDARTVFDEIGSLCRSMIALLPAERQARLVGLGLAMPGSISRNIDLVGGTAADASLWTGLDAVAEAERATGLRVWPFNDGNAACWAELSALPRPRPANMCYFLVSTFIGSGIIADGRLWEGPTGNSANLGSMLVTDRDGRENFVHLLASLMALETKLFVAGQHVPTGNPVQWDWGAFEPVLSEWIENAGRAIALAIANTAAVSELHFAVVDGVMPGHIVERLVDSVRRQSNDLPTLTFSHPDIVRGTYGVAAPAIGAALLPVHRQLFSREVEDLATAER